MYPYMERAASPETILTALGRSDVGAALADQRRLSVDAMAVDTLVQLAASWRGARALPLAQTLAEVALKRDSRHPGALTELGLAKLGMGNFPAALETLEEGKRLHPSLPEFSVNLACVLKALGQLAEARTELERALELAPGHLLALHNLALLALAEHDLEGAARATETLLTLAPESLESRRILIEIHRLRGETARARELVADNLDRDPTHAETLFELAHLDQAEARFEEAERHFITANASARPPSLEPFADFEARLEDQWALYTAIEARGVTPEVAPPLDRFSPVLLVGAPRSGTTLLERMLDLHPDLQSEEEPTWLRALVQHVSSLANQPVGPELLLEEIWIRDNHALLDELRRKYRSLVDSTPAARNGKWPIDKLPANLFNLGIFAALSPGAPVIHLIRDGREVAWSAFTQPFQQLLSHAFDPLDAVAHWAHGIHHARRSAEVFALRYLEVRYEDLVRDPESVLRGVLAHLDLAFDPRCLSVETNRKPASTMSYAQVREPVHTRALRRAERYPRIYAAMTEAVRPLLEELGYGDESRDWSQL